MVVTCPLGPTRKDLAQAKGPQFSSPMGHPSLSLLSSPQAAPEQWTVVNPSDPRGPQETGSDRLKVSLSVLGYFVHFCIL